jgi:hypothetical protein
MKAEVASYQTHLSCSFGGIRNAVGSPCID